MNNAIQTVINQIIKSPGACGEGCKLAAYWDASGKVWTIGYGATGQGIVQETTWTQAQADQDLANRLAVLYPEVIKSSPILANYDNKAAAILDFVYNGGLGIYINHSVKPYVDAGNWQGAAKEILLFDHSGGVVLPGLKARREVESQLLLS
jgi:lysozyme